MRVEETDCTCCFVFYYSFASLECDYVYEVSFTRKRKLSLCEIVQEISCWELCVPALVKQHLQE